MKDQKLYDLATEVRWYIKAKWADAEQQDNARASADRLVDYITGVESTPDPSEPEVIPPTIDPSPDSPDLFGKVALLVGHNERGNQGAWVVGDGISESEFKFYNKVADQMIKIGLGNVEFKRFNRTYGGGYTSEINRVYDEIDAFDPTLVIDMHFNGGGAAYSMVMYHHASKVSKRVADAMSVPFAQRLGLKNYNHTDGKDSVTALSSGENGYYSMARAKCPSVLLEPFFGDHRPSADQIGRMGHSGYAELCLEATSKGLSAINSES